MPTDLNGLRLAVTLKLSVDDAERSPGDAGTVTVAVRVALHADGIRCNGSLNIQLAMDD